MDNITGNILNNNNFLEIDEIIAEAREMNERELTQSGQERSSTCFGMPLDLQRTLTEL